MRKIPADTTTRQYEKVHELWRSLHPREAGDALDAAEWQWLAGELARHFDEQTPLRVFQTGSSLLGGLILSTFPQARLTVIDEDPKRLDLAAPFYARMSPKRAAELTHVPVRRYLGLPEFSPGWFDRQAFDLVRGPADVIVCEGPSDDIGRWAMALFAREMLADARVVIFPRLNGEFALLELFSWRELLGGSLHVMTEPGRLGILLPEKKDEKSV